MFSILLLTTRLDLLMIAMDCVSIHLCDSVTDLPGSFLKDRFSNSCTTHFCPLEQFGILNVQIRGARRDDVDDKCFKGR